MYRAITRKYIYNHDMPILDQGKFTDPYWV